MQPAGAGQGFQPDKGNTLPGFAANAGFEQFVPPLALAQGLARARNRLVGSGLHLLPKGWSEVNNVIHRLDLRRGNRLDGKRAGDAGFLSIRLRLVVQGLDLWRLVIGNARRGDVGCSLIDETTAHTFLRITESVVVEIGGHQALLGERYSYARCRR